MKKIIKLLQSKWREYLIEIAVIIIGILLAFALNNWNENRKQRQDEVYFLSKLKSNLKEDVKLFSRVIDDPNVVDQLDTMLMMFQNPQQYERADFGNKIRYIRHFMRFSPAKMTFDNMISTGRIEVLQNQTLVEKLFLYYRNVEFRSMAGDAALAHYTRDIFMPYFLAFDHWDNFDHILPGAKYLENHQFPFEVNKKTIQAFAEDPMIVNSIKTKLFMLENQKVIYRDLRQEAQEIISLLEAQL